MSEQHHKKLDELIDGMKPKMHEMLDQAIASGALPDEYLTDDNYLLARAIITIAGRKEPYAPLAPSTKKEVKNLEKFI